MAVMPVWLVSYPDQWLEPRVMLGDVRAGFRTREEAERYCAFLRRAWPGIRELRVEERMMDFGDPRVRRRWERLCRGQGEHPRRRPQCATVSETTRQIHGPVSCYPPREPFRLKILTPQDWRPGPEL
jgi:hypothetical protein